MSVPTLFDPTFAGIEATHHPQLNLFGDTMDHDQQRDHQEERYNAELCPLCDYSPCIGDAGKGSCELAEALTPEELRDQEVDR